MRETTYETERQRGNERVRKTTVERGREATSKQVCV